MNYIRLKIFLNYVSTLVLSQILNAKCNEKKEITFTQHTSQEHEIRYFKKKKIAQLSTVTDIQ